MIFLSYPTAVCEWAQSLEQALSARELRVWSEALEVSIQDPLLKGLKRGLCHSHYALFVITPETTDSPMRHFELGVALAGKQTIVPILAPGVAREALFNPFRTRSFLPLDDPLAVADEIASRIAADRQRERAVSD